MPPLRLKQFVRMQQLEEEEDQDEEGEYEEDRDRPSNSAMLALAAAICKPVPVMVTLASSRAAPFPASCVHFVSSAHRGPWDVGEMERCRWEV